MAQSPAIGGSIQQTLQRNVDAEPVPLKRKKNFWQMCRYLRRCQNWTLQSYWSAYFLTLEIKGKSSAVDVNVVRET